MSHTVRKNRYWLVPACLLIAGLTVLVGWQQLFAQTAVDPNTGAAPAAAAAPSSDDPNIPFHAVVPVGVKSANVKNWDGTVTGFIRFKYKTLDNRIITVHLPSLYKAQPMTRAGWDTLFQCYGMDVEAMLAVQESRAVEVGGEMLRQIMENLRKQTPNPVEDAAANPASAAMDYAKISMPAIGNAGTVLPPIF